MIALSLSLALLLELSAGQAPVPPPAPEWPEGVLAKPREELPLVVAALSLPLDPAPALTPLVASWLVQPESWPEGPVARLHAAGGRLSAVAHPDGIVVVAEGPAERQTDVVAAALALLSDTAPSAAGLEPARAEALAARELASRDDDVRARRSLWRAWYGDAAAAARGGPSERALLGAREADARAALEELKRASVGHRLYLEGAVRPSALPSVVAALRPAVAPPGPPSLPRPPAAPAGTSPAALESPAEAAQAPPEAAQAPLAPVAPALVALAHPLPPGPWSAVTGLAFTRALERRLAPLGESRAFVEAGRHARLLVVTLRLPEAPLGPGREAALSEAEAAVKTALYDARQGALTDRALSADLEAAAAELARADRRLGAWAERQAREHLTASVGEAGPSAPSGLEALVGLLRISVLPELVRSATRPPPPPSPAAAPSAPSASAPREPPAALAPPRATTGAAPSGALATDRG